MKRWAKAASIRAIRTVAQAAVASIGTAVVMEQLDWHYIISASVLAGILSILTSLAGLPECEDTPAEINEELLDEITDGKGD